MIESPPKREHTLYRGPWFAVGEFRCPPEDWRWHRINVVGTTPRIVFPTTPVLIEQTGRRPVLATANHVMFYDAYQEYRRARRHERGDECAYVAVEPAALEELAEDLGGRAPFRFPFVQGPTSAPLFLLQCSLRRRAEALDPLAVEEAVAAILVECLRAAFELRWTPKENSAGVVEQAKDVLATHMGEKLGLEELARRVGLSRFHLARVFRRATGFGLHEYRTQLRLRAVLEALAAPDVDLSRLAFELGYSSHSHLTNSFRSAFGVTPSAARSLVRERRGEISTILQAAIPNHG